MNSLKRKASKSTEIEHCLPPQPNFIPKIVFYNIRHAAKKLTKMERYVVLTVKEYSENLVNNNDESHCIMVFSIRFLRNQIFQPVYAIKYSSEVSSKIIVEKLTLAWYFIIKDLEAINLPVIATMSTPYHLFQIALKILTAKKDLDSEECIEYTVVSNKPIIHLYDVNCLCFNLEKDFFNYDLTYFLVPDNNGFEWQIASAGDIKTFIDTFPKFLHDKPFLFSPIFYYTFLKLQEEGRVPKSLTLSATTTLLSMCCICVTLLQELEKITPMELYKLYYDTLEPLRRILASLYFRKISASDNEYLLNNIRTDCNNPEATLRAKNFYIQQLTEKTKLKLSNMDNANKWRIKVWSKLISYRQDFIRLLFKMNCSNNEQPLERNWKRKPQCIVNHEFNLLQFLYEQERIAERPSIRIASGSDSEDETLWSNELNENVTQYSYISRHKKIKISKECSLPKITAFASTNRHKISFDENHFSDEDNFENIRTVFHQLPGTCLRNNDSIIPWEQTLNGFVLLADNLMENNIDFILTNVFSNAHNDYFVNAFKLDTNFHFDNYELLTKAEAKNVFTKHLQHLK